MVIGRKIILQCIGTFIHYLHHRVTFNIFLSSPCTVNAQLMNCILIYDFVTNPSPPPPSEFHYI